MQLSGKVSWFGGPGDPTDSGHTANGETTKTPGIAVYNHSTLGGYWRVRAPNGRTVVLKQTDIGPAPWTGRKIDVTYSALGKFGFGEHNFPTDSEFKAEYLGRNPNAASSTAAPEAPSRAPRLPGVESSGLDQAAFQKAQRASLVGKLIASTEGAKAARENPLVASGLASTKAPNPADYTQATSLPGLPTRSAPTASIPSVPGRTKLGGLLPGNAELQIERLDQGQDIKTKPGGPLIASGDFEVVGIHNDPGGFGERYPVIRFTSGPEAGKTLYFGHTHSALPMGHKGHAGEVISHTGYGTPREGNARTPGWAEIGLWGPGGPGGLEEGKKIAPYLRR